MIHSFIARIARLPLFGRKQPIDGVWEIIKWWEVRRIPFNLIVGVTGLLSGTMVFGVAFVAERVTGEATGWPDPPMFIFLAVIAYGIMANVCYTGGWVMELLASRVWGDRAEAMGEISFTLGMLFSVALTLLPAVVIVGLDTISIIAHVLKH